MNTGWLCSPGRPLDSLGQEADVRSAVLSQSRV